MNALLEEYLRHFVTATQKNWVELLDAAQFSYNLQKSTATGFSPFELANGQQPLTPYEVAKQKTGGKCPTAYRFARNKQEMLEEARDSLHKAAKRMKKYAGQGQETLGIQCGRSGVVKAHSPDLKKDEQQDDSQRSDSPI